MVVPNGEFKFEEKFSFCSFIDVVWIENTIAIDILNKDHFLMHDALHVIPHSRHV